jgi:phosphatidylglycerophosphate synthase
MEVQWSGKAGTLALMFALPLYLLGDALDDGALRWFVLFAAWCFAIGGLALSYWAAVFYVPQARAALREGRASRPAEVAT